ncbi:hypothetical protein METHP14_60078 [Pseudomonas sp. P14-2025]
MLLSAAGASMATEYLNLGLIF